MNNEQKNYLNAVNKAFDISSDQTLQADAIVNIPTPRIVDSSLNIQTLVGFIEEFKFEWVNHDTGDDEELASQVIEKIMRIVSDIKTNNDYHVVFRAETAYGKIVGEEWPHKIETILMSAKTIEEANIEIDEIRQNTAKTHHSKPDFTLDFVRVKYDVLDQNNSIVLKDELIPEEA